MANPDPIGPVVQALSVLVAPNPNPALNTTASPPPSTWTGGSTATPGTLFTPAQALLGLLFGLSSDMTSVGGAINGGLTGVATVIASIANELGSLTAIETKAKGAFGALKTVLGLAQTVAPSGATGVLQSASGLFDQLNSVISAFDSIDVAAAELAELSQQLTAAAKLFPTA